MRGGPMVSKSIAFFLDNKLVTALLAAALILWGIAVAPFEWDISWLPRAPVPVDAIPDIGENQQIVFTRWPGRSPQDIEDQVTYPLTVALLGVPGVKTVRSFSMLGFSSVYVVFEEDVEFYWSRSRILEKLGSLPSGTLPDGVRPSMGPDATALGQVFWYTLEGRDHEGRPTGGWDLQELRSIQDWYVRYGLMAAEGVAEVASVGGFVKEYQVDVRPDALRAHGVTLEQVYAAVKASNLDVGARTVEVNRVEYVVRGVGFVESIADLEKAVVLVRDNVPVRVMDVARVKLGPALRRGVLDKEGAEVVGGVVVTRYGENPLRVIKNVKKQIARIETGLPSKRLPDGRESQVSIVPFYDRSGLIRETLGTLNNAIYLEILVTVLVVLVLIHNLASSMVISSVLPLAVLMSFIGMKLFAVDANIVSLSGIAIAIGTIVDMGIVLSENVLAHARRAGPRDRPRDIVYRASTEVGGAMLTAVLTTVVSFLPVFTMEAAEGKLFKPLAYTKTFALLASIFITLAFLPAIMHVVLLARRRGGARKRALTTWIWSGGVALGGIVAGLAVTWWVGVIVVVLAARPILRRYLPSRWKERVPAMVNGVAIAVVGVLLTVEWLPLGAETSVVLNLAFVAGAVGGLLLVFTLVIRQYVPVLSGLLAHRWRFLGPVAGLVVFGMVIWLGFKSVFFFVPHGAYRFPPLSAAAHAFPGLGKEFMPPLDEGSYLYMPTTMTHASIGEVHDILRLQDRAIANVPEVESVVGKLGRAESALDPAPVSMIETIISIKPEYVLDERGRRRRFAYDRSTDSFARDSVGELVPDARGRPYRQWREHIRHADDIWDEIVRKAQVIGVTSAPKLQPIAARIVMLQSGMRAPMGIKVHGPDLETIERFGLRLEELLKEVSGVQQSAVIADRIVGKPYLEIEIDRDAVARHGLSVARVQNVVEIALGGKAVTSTIEGRERYDVRVRYPRELRGLGRGIEEIERVLIATPGGAQVPLGQLARVEYRRGPQVIKSENTFLTGYVLFDKVPGAAEVAVVESAREYLENTRRNGELGVPPGVSYQFAGSYENQVRSERRLAVILPVALFAVFLILYFQFKRIPTTLLVFAGILVAWSGGFVLIWLYGQEWFLNLSFFGTNLRELFQMHPVNLSVAIWVGFLALFGIASDNGVVICTYLDQRFREESPRTAADVRRLVTEAANRRVRPALMTSATTILALLPVLTSTGRGADVMVPMAIPSFGGMALQVVTIFLAPVLYAAIEEHRLRSSQNREDERSSANEGRRPMGGERSAPGRDD
ncbi:MAG: AcrB/AcrD/AcrF family protein [Chitinivibrionales bacterium]|nr:AcrB/AcrD/AcrF family protein [Chitinivibrionales bacterium]